MSRQDKKKPARPALWRVHPSAFLLAAQLLLLILYSVFDGLHSERALISAFGVAVLVLRVWVVNRSPATDWIAWLLAGPALVLTVLSAFNPDPIVLVWSSLFEAALYFYAAASLIAYMMSDYQVTPDELFAAGATWTLLAWGFAYLYLILQTVTPGSFLGLDPGTLTFTFVELLFLSFTNLSATGLSDIVPATTAARVVMMIEQFAGIGYVAVVVSRLIGLTITRQDIRSK
jgi:hypothetical protein